MKHGLIPDQIAYASSVDVSKCNSVQHFIMQKVNQESYIRYATGYEERRILYVKEEPSTSQPLIKRFSGLLP